MGEKEKSEGGRREKRDCGGGWERKMTPGRGVGKEEETQRRGEKGKRDRGEGGERNREA